MASEMNFKYSVKRGSVDNLDGIRFVGRPIPIGKSRTHPAVSLKEEAAGPPGCETMHPFPSWVLAKAGLDSQNYRIKPLGRRMAACLRVLKAKDSEKARTLLEEHPELLPLAIDSLLIGVTEFFRDEDVFQSLESNILPEIVKSRGGVNVWSAGCSNGSELASIAIFLSEAGALNTSTFLGTDCRSSAIRDARAGLYDQSCLKKVKPEIRHKYFQPEGNRFRFVLPAGGSMSWKISDLFSGGPEGNWDVILCRNLAIYFNHEAADHIWRILAGVLREGGYLVTGKADRPPEPFICLSRGIYRKSGVSQL
jgi:chemotaxis protein methyltransferase CheR